jgi:hypothetical protein
LNSADALACGNGVPVDNGLSRKRGVEMPTGFLPGSGVCTVDSGVDEIAGVAVAVGDKIGVSVSVGVTLASGCGATDATGLGVVAMSAGVGVFPISAGSSAVERTSD